MKCSCRGNNAECHICFGSGVIEENLPTPSECVAVPVRRNRQDRQRAPSRQPRPRPEHATVEAAITMLCTQSLRGHGSLLNKALALLNIWGKAERVSSGHVIEIRTLLAKAIKAQKSVATQFLVTLATEMRRRGSTKIETFSTLSYLMRLGKIEAGIRIEIIDTLVDIYNAQNPVKSVPVSQIVVQEVPAKTTGRRDKHFSPLRNLPVTESKQDNSKAPRIQHALATADDEVIQARVTDLLRFVERHGLKFVYISGSRKGLRSIKNALTSVDFMTVTNSVNLKAIKALPNLAVIALDKTVK